MTTGVPSATNSMPYATRPRWQIAYIDAGETGLHYIDCLREQEALSRFAQARPTAQILSILYTEVPF